MDQDIIYADDLGEVTKAEYPHILSSGGMGPCIAIGVYDPVNRAGYMIHDPSLSHAGVDGRYCRIDAFVKVLGAECGSLDRLKVFVAGGAYDDIAGEESSELSDLTRKDRDYVECKLAEHFSRKQVRMRWADVGEVTELLLDTSKGKFTLEKEILEDCLY